MTAGQGKPDDTMPEYRLRRSGTGFVMFDPERALIGEGPTVEAAHAAIEHRRRQWEEESRRAGLSMATRWVPTRDPEWRRFGFFALRVVLVVAAVLFVMPSPAGVWRVMPPPEVVGKVLLERLHQSAVAASQAKPETVSAILADVRVLAQALAPFVAELRAVSDAAESGRGDARR